MTGLGVMGALMPLFLKELRENRGLFLFLLGATIIVETIALTGAGNGTEQQWSGSLTGSLFRGPMYALLALLPYTTALILAVVLHTSLAAEFKGDSRYLLLSLPVPRSVILAAKLLAVISLSVGIYLVATTALFLVYGQMYDQWSAMFPQIMDVAPTPVSMWSIAGTGYFGVLLLALGLVSVAEGVKCAVKTYRGLTTFGTFVAGTYLFVEFLEPALSLLTGINLAPIDAFAIYALVASLTFLLLGAFLFERYVEA